MDKNFFDTTLDENLELNNFFLQNNANIVSNSLNSTRRLNNTDAKILEEEAYKDVDNEFVKLEVKISKLENSIEEVDNQIKLALNINDNVKYHQLVDYKLQLQQELENLIKEYNKSSLSAKFTDVFNFSKNNIITEIFSAISNKISTKLLAKLPKKFSSTYELKKSLSTLEHINKSVDELMTLQTPYGEAESRYEQISKYITKANYIQSNISKYLK